MKDTKSPSKKFAKLKPNIIKKRRFTSKLKLIVVTVTFFLEI